MHNNLIGQEAIPYSFVLNNFSFKYLNASTCLGLTSSGMPVVSCINRDRYISSMSDSLFSFAASAGTHTFTWSISGANPTPSFYVDDVTLTNAAPALVRWVPHLPPALADSVRGGLRQRYGQAAHGAPCRWFEWNRGRERAVAALRAGGIVRGDAQLHPRDCILILPASGPPA